MISLTRQCFPSAEIIVSNDPEGKGKGWAVREGLKKATKDYVVIINGDLDIHPYEINKLLYFSKTWDIVVGLKDASHLPWQRRIITKFSRWFIKKLFNLPLTDTQTGVKLFPREAIKDYKSDGYIYDVEVLDNAHKKGFTMGETSVFCVSSKSKGLICLFKTLIETLKLYENTLSK